MTALRQVVVELANLAAKWLLVSLLAFAGVSYLAGLDDYRVSEYLRQNPRTHISINVEFLERRDAFFEFELLFPVRFSRWLFGHPRAPLVIAGREYWGDWVVGCRYPLEEPRPWPENGLLWRQPDCPQPITLADLSQWMPRGGALPSDFGHSFNYRNWQSTDILARTLDPFLPQLGLAVVIGLCLGSWLGAFSALRLASRICRILDWLASFLARIPGLLLACIPFSVWIANIRTRGIPNLYLDGSSWLISPVEWLIATVKTGPDFYRTVFYSLPVFAGILFIAPRTMRFVQFAISVEMAETYVLAHRVRVNYRWATLMALYIFPNLRRKFILAARQSLPALLNFWLLVDVIYQNGDFGSILLSTLTLQDYSLLLALIVAGLGCLFACQGLLDLLAWMVGPHRQRPAQGGQFQGWERW